MKYEDLRDFLGQLERAGALRRIALPVDPYLEMTEFCDRTLRAGGPALLFEQPKGHTLPVLANLFGTQERVALGMGQDTVEGLRDIGRLLAFLKEPEPPRGMRDAWDKLPLFRQALNLGPRTAAQAPWQRNVAEDADVDLGMLPIQTCWPGDAGPLITWGLTVPRGLVSESFVSAEDLVSYPRSLDGVRVAMLLREERPGTVKVSLRAKGDVPVNRIAGRFGGGGHENAAGCTIKGTLEEATTTLLGAVDAALNGTAS